MSFSKAADELNVTQGAISRHIKTIEDFMGAPLFRRMARKVELTPFGLKYLEATRAGLDVIEAATLQSLKECHSMTISVLPSIGTLWLLQRLASFISLSDVKLQFSFEYTYDEALQRVLLLSMAKLNRAKSRVRRSIWSLVRIAQTCFCRSGGFAPINFPLSTVSA